MLKILGLVLPLQTNKYCYNFGTTEPISFKTKTGNIPTQEKKNSRIN